MNKIWKIFQYGYIIIAIFFLYDAISKFLSGDNNKAIFSTIFFIFILVVFFFKRHFRKKVIERNNKYKK